MSWRYQLIQMRDEHAEWVELHEVYFDTGTKITQRSAHHVLMGNDRDDLIGDLRNMLKDAEEHGVIDDPFPDR